MASYSTYDEIKTQTEAWAQALNLATQAHLPQAEAYSQVLFTGCGSTYYLSLAAAALYQELTGRPARAVPAGELWLNPAIWLAGGKALLIAISRSGTTTETVQAAESFRAAKRGDVLVISNYDEELARRAETAIVVKAGQEQSVAQTRSFGSMYVAAAAICARMACMDDLLQAMRELPGVGERLISKCEPYARQIGEDLSLERFYFLGSGTRYGLACEANLKMKEMTLTHSEPFHFLEFRHGPMSMVNAHTLIAGLLSDTNREHEAKVLAEMQARGATTVSLGDIEADMAFESGIPECARGVLYLPGLQLMAFHRALAKDLNPDRPNNLTAVVKLDL